MAKVYRFGFKKLEVYQAAVEHFEWTARVLGRGERLPFKVTDQVIGASLSILSNVGEANGRDKQPGEAEQHYRYAQGSTFESASHLDALSALDRIDDEEYNHREECLAQIGVMLGGMIRRHEKRRRSRATRAVQSEQRERSKASNASGPKRATRAV